MRITLVSLVQLLFSCESLRCRAGSSDGLLALIKLKSPEWMCEQVTHACSYIFVSFFSLPLLPLLAMRFFFSTELAPERCNKVVSIATLKRVTDIHRCQPPCCQTGVSFHFIIENIRRQVEVSRYHHWGPQFSWNAVLGGREDRDSSAYFQQHVFLHF